MKGRGYKLKQVCKALAIMLLFCPALGDKPFVACVLVVIKQ